MSLEIKHSSFGQLSNLADSLVIEISDSTIKFCELEKEKHTPYFICEFPIDQNSNLNIVPSLAQAIKHFQFSKKNYSHVYINYFTAKFTLCPTAYYQAENNRSLLEFNVGSILDGVIIVDEVNPEMKLIYSIDESIKSTIDLLFPNHQIKHSLSVLGKLMLTSEELVKENILLSIQSNYIEIIVKQNQKIVLANQYSVKTAEDVLYFLLFILEQYQLNPLTAQIMVVGNLDTQDELIVSIKKYIKNIRLALGNKHLVWTNISGMPQHFNYSLLNRIFCE